ncbi:MAG: hypothetical protein IJS52_09000 [Bacilli bacterium]|nr:hypothetical protein [Bacilli bacterium]
MKYSSTTRLINVVVFALLAIGFGFLGIYFGILVTPFRFVSGGGPLGVTFENVGWGLFAMLGVLGLTGLLVSAYGLVQSVFAVLRGNDDLPVRRAFSSYVALGYVVAIFFFLNAVWLYRLTSTNIGYDDMAFVIIVYVILFLVAIIVSNIPLLRMYGEGEELNKIMKAITGPIVAATFSLMLVYGLSFFLLPSDAYSRAVMSKQLGVPALIFLVAFLLSGAAFLGYGRADKAQKVSKMNGFLFEGSLLAIGAAIIVAGVFEYLSQSAKNAPLVSLVGKSVPAGNSAYMEFAVMSWIVGGLLVILACFLCLSTLKGDKKKQ